MDIYAVKNKDTVASVAKRCGVSAARLAADNGLSPDATLAAGQMLTVRRARTAHTVRHGETLREIASRYNLSVRELYRFNPQLRGLPRLYTGQKLAVQMTDIPKRPLQVLGRMPSTPPPIELRAALPFLTYVTQPPCRVAPNGGFAIPTVSALFATALDYGTLPLLCLDGDVPQTALHRFAETVVFAVAQQNAAGVVMQAAPPLLKTRLEAEKRLLLEPFSTLFCCGADCQKGHTPVFLSHRQTLSLATRNGANIRFDDTVKQPFFQYRDTENRTHTVWFYDTRSWCAQLQNIPDGVTVSDAYAATPLLAVITALRRLVE